MENNKLKNFIYSKPVIITVLIINTIGICAFVPLLYASITRGDNTMIAINTFNILVQATSFVTTAIRAVKLRKQRAR